MTKNTLTFAHQMVWQDAHSPLLESKTIHCWFLLLDLPTQLKSNAYQSLNDIQKDKYHRKRTKTLQDSYLCSRYYLFELLGHYTKTNPQEIKLSYSRLNKPYLSNNSFDLHFNFTDTKAKNGKYYGIYVFCKEKTIGVDIENLNRKVNFAEIANSRFSQKELDFVHNSQGDVDAHKFLAIWTRKEAFGKATGKGINFSMKKRNLIGRGKHYAFIENKIKWQLTQFQPDNELIASIAYPATHRFSIQYFNQPLKRLDYHI